MIALVNPRSAAGSGLARWNRVEPLMRERFGEVRTFLLDDRDAVAHALEAAIRSGDPRIVAAGGDGTVNAVVHGILSGPPEYTSVCVLGALGMGSSNDFHKPFEAQQLFGGLHARINFAGASSCDAGRICLTSGGRAVTRHFFLNASAGITAEGNQRFNHPGPMLDLLKRVSVRAAIAYAAITSLTGYDNIPVRLTIPQIGTISLSLTNLGIMKTPYFSGDLHYDLTKNYTNGRFGVVACEEMGIRQRLNLFRSLQHGSIAHLPGIRSWSSTEVTLSADRPIPIEFDGETVLAETAHFSVLPLALKVCP
jgi:diacylglycerol kinase (ATP)